MIKKIIFVTGTRADFGKLKSLINSFTEVNNFEIHVFITGMHNDPKYGNTYIEVEKLKNVNFHRFINNTQESSMDLTLAKTVSGFSDVVTNINPDMIVVHGDRLEPLSAAIVGSFRNILVSHIEGGELSGTIDELIRHSISKLSQLHFVSNLKAKKRLIQMGEYPESIHIIGSPDIDLMFSNDLPSIEEAKNKYDILFENYSICLFHPVTTEIDLIKSQVSILKECLLLSNKNYIIIYPNNDFGSQFIIDCFNTINSRKIKIIPSLRFEYFLTLLKNSDFIIGNSSAGIREAPYYSLPTINLGSRQQNRDINDSIFNLDYDVDQILKIINKINKINKFKNSLNYGQGDSAIKFRKILQNEAIWKTKTQKQFIEIDFNK